MFKIILLIKLNMLLELKDMIKHQQNDLLKLIFQTLILQDINDLQFSLHNMFIHINELLFFKN